MKVEFSRFYIFIRRRRGIISSSTVHEDDNGDIKERRCSHVKGDLSVQKIWLEEFEYDR